MLLKFKYPCLIENMTLGLEAKELSALNEIKIILLDLSNDVNLFPIAMESINLALRHNNT